MKRGQMQISFGMIFSIILIVIFLAFGFYVISKFLSLQGTVNIGMLQDIFQGDVNRVYVNNYNQLINVSYKMPSKAQFLCFIDFDPIGKGKFNKFYDEISRYKESGKVVYLYPPKDFSPRSLDIKHLDIAKTTQENNPLCIRVVNGQVKFKLEKIEGSPLVIIRE